MAMKMRQSLAQLRAGVPAREAELDRNRRENLRKRAVVRSRKRHHQREQARSSVRFWLLALSLLATALIVTRRCSKRFTACSVS